MFKQYRFPYMQWHNFIINHRHSIACNSMHQMKRTTLFEPQLSWPDMGLRTAYGNMFMTNAYVKPFALLTKPRESLTTRWSLCTPNTKQVRGTLERCSDDSVNQGIKSNMFHALLRDVILHVLPWIDTRLPNLPRPEKKWRNWLSQPWKIGRSLGIITPITVSFPMDPSTFSNSVWIHRAFAWTCGFHQQNWWFSRYEHRWNQPDKFLGILCGRVLSGYSKWGNFCVCAKCIHMLHLFNGLLGKSSPETMDFPLKCGCT